MKNLCESEEIDKWIYFNIEEHCKGKAVPLQASTGPEGSRKLRLPDCKTALEGSKVVSPVHWPPLPPGNIPGSHFF